MLDACTHENSEVIDSRKRENGEIHRRRECKDCGKRFSTVEILRSHYDILQFKIGRAEEILLIISDTAKILERGDL